MKKKEAKYGKKKNQLVINIIEVSLIYVMGNIDEECSWEHIHTHKEKGKLEYLVNRNNNSYLILKPFHNIFLLSFTEPSKEAAFTNIFLKMVKNIYLQAQKGKKN